VAFQIDFAVRSLVNQAYERSKRILETYREQLHAIAGRLIEIETIDRTEFEKIFGEPVQPKISGTPVPVQ